VLERKLPNLTSPRPSPKRRGRSGIPLLLPGEGWKCPQGRLGDEVYDE